MEIVTDTAHCPRPAEGSVVTIGAYDGLHRGHRLVIEGVREKAEDLGCRSAVVTFDRHPASVVRPKSAPKLLTDLAQKLELLETTGVDIVVVIHFDEEQSTERASHFVERVLVDCLAARAVVVGEDFHFGHQREGDVALLTEKGKEAGFAVDPIALVAVDDDTVPVSSTAVRRALDAGEVTEAARMLGRDHEVRGLVAGGDKRGRELGFPTANVAVPGDICLPADGIYAGWYERPDGEVLAAAISLGRRPTFYEEADQSLLEAYLLDFSGDLYGEPAKVRFVERLRGEERFDSVEALVEQMHADVEKARHVLGVANP